MPMPVITPYPDATPEKGQGQTTFDTNIDNFLNWLTLELVPDFATFIPWADGLRATLVAANLPSLTGNALNTVRVNAAEDDVEFASLQEPSAVTITGGTITGITDLAIADGGTGASTAATAFTALKQDATDTATGVVELATTAEGNTGTSTTLVPAVSVVKSMIDANASYKFIATADISSDATISFTGFDAAKYDYYDFVFMNVIPETDNAVLLMYTSTDGGSSYDTGASDYGWVLDTAYDNGTSAVTADNLDSKMNITAGAPGVGSAAGEDGISGIIRVWGPHLARDTNISWQTVFMDSNGRLATNTGAGQRRATSDVDAVRFKCSSASIESGTITMYGGRNV